MVISHKNLSSFYIHLLTSLTETVSGIVSSLHSTRFHYRVTIQQRNKNNIYNTSCPHITDTYWLLSSFFNGKPGSMKIKYVYRSRSDVEKKFICEITCVRLSPTFILLLPLHSVIHHMPHIVAYSFFLFLQLWIENLIE